MKCARKELVKLLYILLPEEVNEGFFFKSLLKRKGKCDAFTLIHPRNTCGLQFASEEQKLTYKKLSINLTFEKKFRHADALRILGLLDNVGALLGNLGWLDYVI